MIDEVAEILAGLESEGTFATALSLPSDNLRIRVDGVGPIRFPISSGTATKLAKLARPALFGKRTRTIYDPEVRDTGEVPADSVHVDGGWTRALEASLEHIRRRLGLAADTRLEAKLDKLLVYGPGQFFAPHQDSERADAMIGTLVLELPSFHRGGSLIVEHRGKKRTFAAASGSGTALALVGFYADCRHEVKPVESGYRIALTYHLLAHAPARPSRAATRRIPAVEQLTEAVRIHLGTAVAPRYGSAPPEAPEHLVYLLDHEYSERSLAWNRLKNGDRVRAHALREVAAQLDCEVYLALADVHENWACADGDERYGGLHDEDDSDDDEDAADGEYELLDLNDMDVELRHLVAADGSVSNARIKPAIDEVCFTRESHELKPFKSEHEGYMGNYGNTVDRWYHRAAVVLWLRSRSFVLRAKAEPSWAVAQIAKLHRSGQIEGAQRHLAELLPIWERSVRSAGSDLAALPVLKLSRALDDAEVAARLLGPFDLSAVTGASAGAFGESVEHFGFEWGKRILAAWRARGRYGQPSWLPGFARMGAALHASGKSARDLGIWLLEQELASLREDMKGFWRQPIRHLRDSERSLLERVRHLLDAARTLDATRSLDDLVQLVATPDGGLPVSMAAALLKRLAKDRTAADTRAMLLGPLYQRATLELAAQVRAPPRARDDWSIAPRRHCDCQLCSELGQFLGAPEQIELRWPLSTEKRQHIHHAIDDDELPVSHETERRGSPYTLVLKKLPALFKREEKARAESKQSLAWLEKNRGHFVE